MKPWRVSVAGRELHDAFDWHESQSPGLGYECLNEFDRAMGRVLNYPESRMMFEEGMRRALRNRFP